MKTTTRATATVTVKLFHNDMAEPMKRMDVTVTRDGEQAEVRVANLREATPGSADGMPEHAVFALVKTVKRHALEWLKDKQFCVLWDDATGIETTLREI